MRLLLLSLLAVSAHAKTIGYRDILQAYTPARGEFPVRSELAQGYLRYLDNTGAERLVAYAYPEPLYGIRTEKYVTDQVNPFLRSSIVTIQEPQSVVVAGLSPEVQRAREEHLRIWNESRRQVLQTEAAQATAPQTLPEKTQLAAIPEPIFKTIEHIKVDAAPTQQQQTTTNVLQSVQETEEVLRARQEHLRLYNEALQQQSQTAPIQLDNRIDITKSIPYYNTEPLQTPQPVEETIEVKRAREEHLKQFNEALLRQSAPDAPQSPVATLPTAAAKTTISQSYDPLTDAAPQPLTNTRISIPTAAPYTPAPLPTAQSATREQQIQLLNQAKLTAEDKVADIEERIQYEEREAIAERERELELRREEQRQAELERMREEQRIIEEQRLLIAERTTLEQEEQQRMERERLEETRRMQAEQQEQEQLKTITEQGYKLAAPTKPQPTPIQPQTITQQQQVQNGFFLRIQSAPEPAAEISADAYVLAEHSHNPFLLRYIQQPQQQFKIIPGPSSISPSSPSSAPSSLSASLSSSSTLSSSGNSIGLSELELANREHFKAHDIALEQLRLANLKNPSAIPCQ